MAALDTMPMLYAFEDMESGGKESSIENDFAYRNNVVNASQKIRMGMCDPKVNYKRPVLFPYLVVLIFMLFFLRLY